MPVNLEVTGDSMWPTIASRAQLVLRNRPSESLRVGDVALALCEGGRVLLHRVIDIQDKTVVLRGDFRRQREVVSVDKVFATVAGICFYRWQWTECPTWLAKVWNHVCLGLHAPTFWPRRTVKWVLRRFQLLARRLG